MSKSWHDRQSEILLPLGKSGLTRQELVDMRCPSLVGVGKLRRVMEKFRVTTLEGLARHATADDIISLEGVGETTVAVFCHLLFDTKVRPWEWLDGDVKITTRKEKLKKKKKKKR